jgi:feruloyl esterase
VRALAQLLAGCWSRSARFAGALALGGALAVGGASAGGVADPTALAALAPAPLPADQRKPTAECTVASMQAASPADTTIVSAQLLQTPVPHCKVDGYVTTVNPGPNKVNFSLQLPARDKWNGRFYFGNQGGSGGSIPIEAQHPQGNPLNAGFAWAGTAKGHSNVGNVGVSGEWEKDPAKVIDNAHRGAHVVAVATQQMTRAYYGVSKIYRYAGGCSGGGGMGQAAVSHYPEDYDGVMMGGQPLGTPPDPLKRKQFEHAIMVQESLREPGAWISPGKRDFAGKKIMEACDAKDGAVDGVIADQRLCTFDFRKLQCKAGDGPECLTRPEITSFENMLKFSYMPISNIEQWGYLGLIPPEQWSDQSGTRAFAYTLTQGWIKTHLGQSNRDLRKQPLTRDEMWRIMVGRAAPTGAGPYGTVGAWRDFAKAGGKLIFFTGEGDPCCSAIMNEQYFRDTWKLQGRANVDRFAKLYMIPGWGHCGGTNGPADAEDHLLTALIDWVEKGKEPGPVVAGRGSPDRTHFLFMDFEDRVERLARNNGPHLMSQGLKAPARDVLLCPFPKVALFDKTKASIPGAVFDAGNWSCVSRQQQARALGLKKPISHD